jgi:prevent-host-death family protein
MAKFVHVRDLKNQTTALLREVETGTTVIVTRRGKPIATLKPFHVNDVKSDQGRYPTTVYAALRQQIEARLPGIKERSDEEQRRDFATLTRKMRKGLPFKSWQEMDRAAKGARYDLTRQ